MWPCQILCALIFGYACVLELLNVSIVSSCDASGGELENGAHESQHCLGSDQRGGNQTG